MVSFIWGLETDYWTNFLLQISKFSWKLLLSSSWNFGREIWFKSMNSTFFFNEFIKLETVWIIFVIIKKLKIEWTGIYSLQSGGPEKQSWVSMWFSVSFPRIRVFKTQKHVRACFMYNIDHHYSMAMSWHDQEI